MNIGDKVRNLAGNEEGVIVRFLDGNQIEVEIEDGFRIPFMKGELVVVASTESEFFGEREEDESLKQVVEKTKTQAIANKGVYLAFSHRNERQLDVYLINNTDLEVLYTFGEEEDRNYSGVKSGNLIKRNYEKLTEMNLDKFERWPNLLLQLLFFKLGGQKLQEPLVKKLRFKAASFHKSKREAPILDQEAYLFQLDAEIKALDPEKILDRIASNSVPDEPAVEVAIKKQVSKAKQEVDLHAQVILGKDAKRINKDEILNHQLRVFEETLDHGILSGLDEMVFIHGVGNGVLKHEIQKRLSKNPHVKFFKDARKEKFGYGATQAIIK